ncbi:hypothetical protein EON67_04370 [archaeon]|nr:MAG: hypothetical protein EON67_04370 [archaeon]
MASMYALRRVLRSRAARMCRPHARTCAPRRLGGEVVQHMAADAGFPACVRVHSFEVWPGRTLAVCGFSRVSNAADLLAALRAKALDVALLHAPHVAGLEPLLVAANKALYYQLALKKLRASSLHAELLLCLLAGKNVMEAFKQMGGRATSTDIIVAIFDATPADVRRVCDLVAGDLVDPVTLLGACVDTAALVKQYKVSAEELSVGSLADAVMGRIAVQEYTVAL